MTYRAHPSVLDATGETAALILGLSTLRLVATRGRYELETRWTQEIKSYPPGSHRPWGGHVIVLATHRCGIDLGHGWPDPPKKTRTTTEEVIPF